MEGTAWAKGGRPGEQDGVREREVRGDGTRLCTFAHKNFSFNSLIVRARPSPGPPLLAQELGS